MPRRNRNLATPVLPVAPLAGAALRTLLRRRPESYGIRPPMLEPATDPVPITAPLPAPTPRPRPATRLAIGIHLGD